MTTRTTSFPLSGPINLATTIGSGSITVRARDDLEEATVTLSARTSDSDILDRVTVELQGPTLVVKGPVKSGRGGFWRNEHDSVDAEIVVPTGTALKIATASAPVTVTGTSGGADIVTGSADVTIDTVGGDLRLRAGASGCRVGAVHGDVSLHNGSGPAHFGEIGGRLKVGTGSGDLDVTVVRGGVRTRAGSGNARLDAVFGDVDAMTGSGSLTVGLPSGVTARIDARSGSGQVHSDLPVASAAAGNGPAISIRLRSGSGAVRLFRAASAA